MPVAPDVTVNGKIATATSFAASLSASEPELGTVQIALCGYGSQVPRVAGEAIFGRVTTLNAETDTSGNFRALLYSNEKIIPEGTYYTVTTRDSNGDIVQVEAYFFQPGSWDLSNMQPYDPGQPPPPLPPLIIPRLLNLGIAVDNIVFPGDEYTAFLTTLTSNVTNATIEGMVPGNLYTFIILQDTAGGHTFGWPVNVYNATRVSPVANTYTIQTFVALEDGSLYAIGPGTYYTL